MEVSESYRRGYRVNERRPGTILPWSESALPPVPVSGLWSQFDSADSLTLTLDTKYD